MKKLYPIFISVITVIIYPTIAFGGTNYSELACESCKPEEPVVEIKSEPEPEPESKPDENNEDKSNPIRWARSYEGQLYLVEKELEVYEIMKEYEIELANKLNHVYNWLNDFEDSSLKGTIHLTNTADKIDEITSHPLMALRMIRRFVNLNRDILTNDTSEKALQGLNNEIAKKSRLPSTIDYEDAMQNIIYSAYAYELNKTDIMNGKISNIQTKVDLTLEQGYDIAMHAEKTKAYSEAYFWLKAVNDTPKIRNNREFPIEEDVINADVERIATQHDKLLDSLALYNPDSLDYWRKYYRFTKKMLPNLNNIEKLQTFKEYLPTYHIFKFQKLCKGANYQTEKEKSKLICFYESKSHPRWRINPVKIEVYSWEPYVVRYYEILPSKSIEYIKNKSRPKMKGATVVNIYYNESDPSTGEPYLHHDSRIASYTFLRERDLSIDYIEQIIADMTGLEVNSTFIPGTKLIYASENIQVASYATGGLYEYHLDGFPDKGEFYNQIEGNRIATFLVYLNDVELGGETAFPGIGIAAKPIKNSAVFWYNLKRNGEQDIRMVHGGCPVLFGKKQISNVWIRGAASFLKRKCLLDPSL